MPHPGQEIGSPGGMRLRFDDITDEQLTMEASYPGDGSMPPEHLHPHQDERFTVLEGAIRAVIGGDEHRYGAGETFVVPAGTPHTMGADGPTRMRWEVRPALRTAEFFETLYSGDAPPTFLDDFAEEFRLT